MYIKFNTCSLPNAYELRSSLFIRKESSVKVDSGYLSLIGFLVHRSLAHQEQNRFLTGHRPTHPRNPPEVLLEPLYPVRGVDHGLDSMIVVQVSEVRLVGRIGSTFEPDKTLYIFNYQLYKVTIPAN